MGNLKAAWTALQGLAYAEAAMHYAILNRDPRSRLTSYIPKHPTHYGDNTEMAQSVYECLRLNGEIDPEKLAESLGQHFDPKGGYGGAMSGLLMMYKFNQPWTMAAELFEGQGSYGSGAAARVAPLGAYFADDIDKVIEQARLSASVTHTHPEATVATIAVAVATAYAVRFQRKRLLCDEFLQMILPHVPESSVRQGIERALEKPTPSIPDNPEIEISNMWYWIRHQREKHAPLCHQVPLALWCAGQYLAEFNRAVFHITHLYSSIGINLNAISAIVGGVVAAHVGEVEIPAYERGRYDALPFWAQKP